jgi:hypothetical protein
MGTPANIIIQHNESKKYYYYYGDRTDEILIFVGSDGYYYRSSGVIHTLVKAYSNLAGFYNFPASLRQSIDIRSYLNSSVRTFDASSASIVYAGFPSYEPVSRLGYEEYAKEKCFYDYAFQYILRISDEVDEEGDIIWEITLKKALGRDITRTIKQWIKFSELDIALQKLLDTGARSEASIDEKSLDPSIKDSIHLGEVDPNLLTGIYRDVSPCPCDECVARAKCVQIDFDENYRGRQITDSCKGCKTREDYLKEVQPYLLEKLSYDKQLRQLLEQVCSEHYSHES